jgi:hypothetical protein
MNVYLLQKAVDFTFRIVGETQSFQSIFQLYANRSRLPSPANCRRPDPVTN